MKNRKLVIFDWNGTLIADTAIGWQATLPCLDFYGCRRITIKEQRALFDFPVFKFYQNLGCNMDKVMATKEESNQIFQDNYDRLSVKARTRRGARELLEWLKKRDVTCIILSNYIHKKLVFHLKRLKLDHYFVHVSANGCNGTTVLDTMNKHARLEAFMDEHGFASENAVIIGDSKEEPEIGRRYGIASIGITNGCINEKRLRTAKPDHVITALPQAIEVINDKWGI